MRPEIRLTDREFPVTPYFVDFLHQFINKKDRVTLWSEQTDESKDSEMAVVAREAGVRLQKLMSNNVARKAISRRYELFMAILLGSVEKLTALQQRFKFIVVVGIPRSGGSYLTKQLYQAIGMEAKKVPRVIAHDGFPELSPFFLFGGINAHTLMMDRMAEYLCMVELYFANARSYEGRIIVPKKASKAPYHGAFFNNMLGPATEYLITLRHPVAACISTYEKSGGLPESGKFTVRGGIEAWTARDYVFTAGGPDQAVFTRDYLDVYLRFWEQYHHNLALTGLSANRQWTIVPYTKEAMTQTARNIYHRFGYAAPAEPFRVFDKRGRHPEWNQKAEQAILRVRDVWSAVGLKFPVEEIMLGW